MKIRELNERALIDRIAKQLSSHGKNTIVGAGEDDCAVLDTKGDDFLLATTDMLHRKTDFPPQMSGWQIGWMSVAVNLSDLASKGAQPIGILMAIGIPPDYELEFFDGIVRGMDDCAKRFGIQVIGGDLDSHDELTITGTALGLVNRNLLVRRSGARPGDLVCVTGNLGTAGAALISLEKNVSGINPTILKVLFEPIPRINEGIALVRTRAVTSMMDISDGLAISLHDIAKASGAGFKIYENKIPVLPEVRDLLKGDELLEAALFRGGDFELLFTIDANEVKAARNACEFAIIGEVIDKGIFIERQYGTEELKQRGFEHFIKK